LKTMEPGKEGPNEDDNGICTGEGNYTGTYLVLGREGFTIKGLKNYAGRKYYKVSSRHSEKLVRAKKRLISMRHQLIGDLALRGP